jgi:CRISPR-associated endonuclease/helicase Cas3
MKHYAHSLPGRPEEEWQALDEHLMAVGDMAERFASSFAPGFGRLAGLWHDAGKYQKAFQDYIRKAPDAHVNERVDHSSVGAVIAREWRAPMVAFAVAGHHGGLKNALDVANRLAAKQGLLADARRNGLPKWLEESQVPLPPSWLVDQRSMSLWTRMIFSALVDADFLDTESFYAQGKFRDVGNQPSLTELRSRLDEYLLRKSLDAPPTPMNLMRGRVLRSCREAAVLSPGVFSLTVPTGGGKTLASLAFALEHAIQHGLPRVIVVIPFTSIIEQTANAYRLALGDDAVVEHHSNLDPDKETPLNRLSSENWDARVVVTTSVQFFESLYANRTSRCRKLHRIANSVVVFDEVQTFPVNLLSAVKHVLEQMTRHYGMTALLCTATQPAILSGVREVIPDAAAEFAVVAGRYEVLLPGSEEPTSWESLANEIRGLDQVLAIVHRRDDAQRLTELCGDDVFHLSARMCGAHRSEILFKVKERLRQGATCRLVATQLVEAGVDIDFPEVFRAFAGADSLAQAAGRCNREGKGQGRLHVFFAPTKPPKGILRTGEAVARLMWKAGSLDLTSPATFEQYFKRLYASAELDSRSVMAAELEQRFADVADAFRMIPEIGEPVVAPFGDSARNVETIRRDGISRLGMRRLQRFLVNLYPQEIAALNRAGALERVADAFWVVVPGFRIYDEHWGFGWKDQLVPEPEDLIA